MGLSQSFRFNYQDVQELEAFFESLADSFWVEKKNDLYIIAPKEGEPFEFEASIEDYGLKTHRAGEYFEFLGVLVERLTGQFGPVEIDDL